MFLISGLININGNDKLPVNGNDKLPVFKNFIHKKLHFYIQL
jgi:hypothetical protein